MSSGAENLRTGDDVGGYQVRDLLGWGSYARVYRVTRSGDGTEWALKVHAGTGAMSDRFELEGVLQNVLDHPNLVRVVEVVEVEGSAALAMELVEGPSLRDWLVQNLPTPELAVELVLGIALGVRHIHRAGLVHRDLKPANVLLATGPGGRLVPRVTDFGLAKLTGGLRSVTLIGTSMGTPEYAAPEQLRDASTADRRADLYALGCIFYELVCGVGPFAGKNAYELRLAQRDGTWARPEAVVPDLPEEVCALIKELLAFDREGRPADLEEVVERLEALRPRPPPPAATRLPLAPFLLLPLIAVVLAAIAVTQCG